MWNGICLAVWLRVWEVMAKHHGSVARKGDSQALGPYCYLWMKTVSGEVEGRTLYSQITDIVGLNEKSLCGCTTLVSVHLIGNSTMLWIASIVSRLIAFLTCRSFTFVPHLVFHIYKCLDAPSSPFERSFQPIQPGVERIRMIRTGMRRHSRTNYLDLGISPHPEGGYFDFVRGLRRIDCGSTPFLHQPSFHTSIPFKGHSLPNSFLSSTS
jgi:hypothetical protein